MRNATKRIGLVGAVLVLTVGAAAQDKGEAKKDLDGM